MYFIPTALMSSIQEALRYIGPIPEAAFGRYTYRGTEGYVVNADALNMNLMTEIAHLVAGTPVGFAEFIYTSTQEGLCVVSLGRLSENLETLIHDDGDGDDYDTGLAGPSSENILLAPMSTTKNPRENRKTIRQGPSFVPVDQWTNLISNLWETKKFLISALEECAPGLPSPLRIFVQNVYTEDSAEFGLPDVEVDDDLVICLLALPGSPSKRKSKITFHCVQNLNRREIQVAHCELPPGMTPISISGTQVACYDEKRLFLHTANATLIAHIIPLWAELLKPTPKAYPSEDELERMTRELSGAMLRSERRELEQARHLVNEIVCLRNELASYREKIAFKTFALDNLSDDLDPEELRSAVSRIREDSEWRVFDHDEVIMFSLRNPRVVDPRNGREKRMPELSLSLNSMLLGQVPFSDGVNDHAGNDHPRIFAGDFISSEASDAFREIAQSGDIEGALAFAREILTNFSAEDPDVACLDRWQDA